MPVESPPPWLSPASRGGKFLGSLNGPSPTLRRKRRRETIAAGDQSLHFRATRNPAKQEVAAAGRRLYFSPPLLAGEGLGGGGL